MNRVNATHNKLAQKRIPETSAGYAACYWAPFGVVGVRTESSYLVGIDFLSRATPPLAPADALAGEVCDQLQAYFRNPHFRFDLPLDIEGTLHQKAVWRIMLNIPAGETRTYGEVAKQLRSAPRAVGQACGANRIPIVIPCHRIVGKSGLGGFMNAGSGESIDIKRWLVEHERG